MARTYPIAISLFPAHTFHHSFHSFNAQTLSTTRSTRSMHTLAHGPFSLLKFYRDLYPFYHVLYTFLPKATEYLESLVFFVFLG